MRQLLGVGGRVLPEVEDQLIAVYDVLFDASGIPGSASALSLLTDSQASAFRFDGAAVRRLARAISATKLSAPRRLSSCRRIIPTP